MDEDEVEICAGEDTKDLDKEAGMNCDNNIYETPNFLWLFWEKLLMREKFNLLSNEMKEKIFF